MPRSKGIFVLEGEEDVNVLSQNLSIEAHSGRKTSQTRLLMDRKTGASWRRPARGRRISGTGYLVDPPGDATGRRGALAADTERERHTDADPLLSQAQHRDLLQDFLADHPDPRGARQPVSASTLNRMHVADSLRFRPLRTPDELRTLDDRVIPEQEGQASRSPLETLFAAGEDLSVIPPTTFVHRGQSDRPRSFTFGLDTQPNEEEQALAMRWPDFDPAY